MDFEKSTSKRVFVFGLNAILSGCYLFYHCFLDYYYCLSADDFSGIDYSSQGIPGITYAWHFYWNWEGPFLSHFVHGSLMWFVSIGVSPVFVLITTKLAMVIACSMCMWTAFDRFITRISWVESWFYGLVFTNVLYLISPNQTQIWHWLTGMVYLYPIVFLMLGVAAIFRDKLLLAVVPMAFVMQSRATYAVLIFGFIVLVTAINWWAKTENKKQWLVLSVFLFLFLAIYFIAPGNYVRLTEHGNSSSFLVSQFQIGLQNLFVSYNIAKMDRVLLGWVAVLPLIGASVSVPRPKQVWVRAIPAVLYVGFAVAHEALFVYITGYREWSRVLSLHSFLFLVTASVYGFWFVGLINRKWRAKIWPLSAVGILGLSFHLFKGFGTELQMAEHLKVEYGNRMETISTHQQPGDTLYVKPMNYTGILYFEDFSENPDNWINKDFCKAYDLNFKVALEKSDGQ